ncbi:hypothetical protein CLOM_g2297 [Closterium sp. NIES-68]|nr:hypothetical protein CLOM_g2297 [Closterium sp. NIES-68]GJP73389.1 hypothetical protein CLOP_g4108 [Closterium sp. NIES-67]
MNMWRRPSELRSRRLTSHPPHSPLPPLLLLIALLLSSQASASFAAAPPPLGQPGSPTPSTYVVAEMRDGEARAVIYLSLDFYTNTSTIQAQYKLFAALPAGPPTYITLASTTLPSCDPSKCSLPPATPSWTQPVPSVWVADGTFYSTPGTDPERHSALLQLIDNSSVFPNATMAYSNPAMGGLRSATGRLRIDTNMKFLEVGNIPTFVPNPNFVVRFRSYMPGGANLTLTQSADGLRFRIDVIYVVVVPTDEPFGSGLAVFLQDAAAPPPSSDPQHGAAGGCKPAGKEKENRKGKSKVTGRDKPKCNNGKGGKGEEDECCDDASTPPTITSTILSLISKSGTCDYTCPSVFALYGTREWAFDGFTPEVRAMIADYNALTALMQYAATGVKGRLVNASMRVVSIDMPYGPNDLLERKQGAF